MTVPELRGEFVVEDGWNVGRRDRDRSGVASQSRDSMRGMAGGARARCATLARRSWRNSRRAGSRDVSVGAIAIGAGASSCNRDVFTTLMTSAIAAVSARTRIHFTSRPRRLQRSALVACWAGSFVRP